MVMNIYYIILDIFALHIYTTLDGDKFDEDSYGGGMEL